MEDIKRVPCVSCKESIIEGASVCPYCQSHQSRPKIHLLANVLKWAAGIITLITLLRSASDLNKLVTVWLEKEQIAVEYINAAKLLTDTGDHKNAQLLLLRAEELKPTSSEIRDIKIGLAKEAIRSYLLLDSHDNQIQHLTEGVNKAGEKVLEFQPSITSYRAFEALQIEELILPFTLEVVSTTGKEKATLLAYLGWMNILRKFGPIEFDVEKHLKAALEIDSQNPIANAMYGAWLLSQRNTVSFDIDERISLSRKHFETALKENELTAWVRALWIESVIFSHTTEAEHELLKILQEFKDAGEPLADYPVWFALEENFINTVAWGKTSDEIDEGRLQSLLSAFTLEDLRNKLNWLSVLHYGCSPGPGCETENKRDMPNLLYAMGRILEGEGKIAEAMEAFRLAQSIGYDQRLLDKLIIGHLENFLQNQGISSRQVLICQERDEPPLKRYDVLVQYKGKEYPTKSTLLEIKASAMKGQPIEMKILRDGQFITLSNESSRTDYLVPLVVPENLLQADQAAELRAWLSTEQAYQKN